METQNNECYHAAKPIQCQKFMRLYRCLRNEILHDFLRQTGTVRRYSDQTIGKKRYRPNGYLGTRQFSILDRNMVVRYSDRRRKLQPGATSLMPTAMVRSLHKNAANQAPRSLRLPVT